MAFGDVGLYAVLTNCEGQHSLWPDAVAVPEGWTVVKGPSPKEDAIAFVEASWTDMAPASLKAPVANRMG